MNPTSYTISLELAHAFGSTCSFNYNQAISIFEEQNEEPKILFPAGKTMAKKCIQRSDMEFIVFDNSAQIIECIHVLPTRTHVATSEKPFGSDLRVVRIYPIKGHQKPHTIKIFNDRDSFGVIKAIVFSYSQPQFMCCLVGEPYHKLIFIDISKNKPLAESNFAIKEVQKISINPKNSHLVCASGGTFLKLFKIEEYAFKPLEQIKKLPKGCKFMNHAWYRTKMILVVTDRCQVLVVEEIKTGFYQVKQEYKNAFNEPNPQKIMITSICAFSKGFVIGSDNGKFSLWVRKQEGSTYQDQKLSLVRKWSTTNERASKVTGISISNKEDILAISLANNDVATIFLNELLPQVMDIDLQKEKKEVFFQYMHKGFHNSPVTGMDVCLQRPLFATCSHEDSTIRIWNYKNFGCKLLRMFYFRIKDEINKPLRTLTFHPTGYYLAVSCTDKLRFFYVLSNQLRPYRQISIKNADIVKFSNGGHYLAVASRIKEQSHEHQVHILNAITLEELGCLHGHGSQIAGLEWKWNDESLCSISKNPGHLIEWRSSDWKEIRNIKKPQFIYNSCKYFGNGRDSIIIFGQKQHSTEGRKNFIHEYLSDEFPEQNRDKKQNQVILSQYQVDAKVSAISTIRINKQSVLIFGLYNGSILIVGLQKQLKPLVITNQHMKPVTQISISPCNRYLMTAALDCMIFVYRIHFDALGDSIDDCSSNVVDDFLADVVLFHKKQIVKYNDKEKQYSKVLGNLQKRLEIISSEAEKKHNQKVQELEIQKNRVIEDLKYRISRIQQQIETINDKNHQALQDLDSKNFSEVQNLQQKYQQKIQFQKQKYFQLEQEIIQEKILHKKKLEELEVTKEKQVNKITQEFKDKLKESENIYTKSKTTVTKCSNMFEERIKDIESEQEEELRELQERLQHFKLEKITMEEQMHQKITKAKREHVNSITQRDQIKKSIEQLKYNKKKMEKELEEAREKLKDMNIEYVQKIQILKNKEVKISQFQKKVNDLQKKKHILSYKATQMKKALEPKDMQIQKLKLDLMKLKKQFELSLEKKQKQVLSMEKMQKQRQQLQKQVNKYATDLNKSVNSLDQIIYEIYNCIDHNKNNPNTDSKIYLKEVVKLYHKYVQKLERKQETQDSKGVEQMTKQIVHLQKSLFQINQTNEKSVLRKNEQINKRIKENAELISNLNVLKKDNLELSRKIKAKNQEIEQQRILRSQLLAELKKVDEQQYQRSQFQDDVSLDSLKMSSLQDKKPSKLAYLESLTSGTRDKSNELIISLKKKENELISQLQFLKEKSHKADFFLKEVRQNTKKHNSYYRCENKIQLDQDLSEIRE